MSYSCLFLIKFTSKHTVLHGSEVISSSVAGVWLVVQGFLILHNGTGQGHRDQH